VSSCDTPRMTVTALPDLNALPAEELRAMILAQHRELITKNEQLLSRDREIEHLKLLLIKLHRMQFGRKSEKLARQIEQLELRLEELESNRSEEASPSEMSPVASTPRANTAKPARRALPDHLPRETRTHVPKATVCPQCQGALRKLGEDVSEIWSTCPTVSW
jgi:transposase